MFTVEQNNLFQNKLGTHKTRITNRLMESFTFRSQHLTISNTTRTFTSWSSHNPTIILNNTELCIIKSLHVKATLNMKRENTKKSRLLNAYFQTCPVLNGAPIYQLIISFILLQPSYRSESTQQEQLFSM